MKDISKGYIALYRQFIEWEWFTDVNVCHLFTYCLLRANHKNTQWRGIELKKGQFVTSFEKLSVSTGLTVMQVRTALNKLKITSEITCQSTNCNSIITVNNWKLYQEDNKRNNKRITTDNNENNISNTSYINNTHTNKKSVCVKSKISKEDMEILKTYANKANATNNQAYVHTLINNGGYLGILEEEKKRLQAKEAKKKQETTKEVEEVLTPEEEKEIKERIKKHIENMKRNAGRL